MVATSVSNHGIGASPGRHLLTADEPEEFAAAVVGLLRDPARREELGRAGQEFVRARYNLDEALDRWEATVVNRRERKGNDQ